MLKICHIRKFIFFLLTYLSLAPLFAQTPLPDTNSFTLTFSATLQKPEEPVHLVTIPDVLKVTLSMRGADDTDTRLNYCNFRMPDGSLPVMEATLSMSSEEHPDWKQMTIGFPLACLKEPYGRHDFLLSFTGARWELYADSELMDLDFPFGYPPLKANPVILTEPLLVHSHKLLTPALPLVKQETPEFKNIQYWTPKGFNTWVGDVATGYYNGYYHLFYLLDRRHHASKWGKGAHYFEHLSTADFKTWTEHEAAVPIEEQWECIGTGQPFVSNGNLCIAFGWHTERIYLHEQLTESAQLAYLKEHGHTRIFTKGDSGVPVGASYSISEDGGRTFKKTWKTFHPSRNPSVYNTADGKLKMLANYIAKGTWEADSINDGWRCINPDFPPGGDCTNFFHWGRYDYIIGGFASFYLKPAGTPDSEYRELVSEGLDIYDGMSVPWITGVGKNRFIMAGWTGVHGWGGHLVLRELIQYPDGRLGCKWLPEVVPLTGKSGKPDISSVNPTGSDAFLLSFKATPGKTTGRLEVNIRGWKEACRFEIDLQTNRAQFAAVKADGTTDRQKSFREGTAIQMNRQYAIENLIATDKPFAVRIIVKYDPKAGGSLIDAEIAGNRTMIGFWPGLQATDVSFGTQDIKLTDAVLAPLIE
jgi:hypothetical protein